MLAVKRSLWMLTQERPKARWCSCSPNEAAIAIAVNGRCRREWALAAAPSTFMHRDFLTCKPPRCVATLIHTLPTTTLSLQIAFLYSSRANIKLSLLSHRIPHLRRSRKYDRTWRRWSQDIACSHSFHLQFAAEALDSIRMALWEHQHANWGQDKSKLVLALRSERCD